MPKNNKNNKDTKTIKFISLSETIKIMFPSMRYGLKSRLNQSVRFFVYDLGNPVFSDFTPKFFVSKEVQLNPRYKEILPVLSNYSKYKVYKILNNENMTVHEDHVVTNAKIKSMLLECKNHEEFKAFVRDNYAIAFITKAENKMLDDAGLNSERGPNLESAIIAYRKAGVVLKKIK